MLFSTKIWFSDIEFIPLGQKDYLKTPEGIAHFLEHKLFENEDGTDASNIFASLGADVNAFTTNYQNCLFIFDNFRCQGKYRTFVKFCSKTIF
ncbi:MAG: insulinase family protein [Christensenellales bacterium]